MLSRPKLSFLLSSLLLALVSCSSNSPQASVQTKSGTFFGNYEVVYFSYGSSWAANHSIVRLLQQEVARRGMAVKPEMPEEGGIPESAMELKVDFAGDKKADGIGRVDFLSHLRFQLLDHNQVQLANVSYDGDDLDLIEQKQLARNAAEQLFGTDG